MSDADESTKDTTVRDSGTPCGSVTQSQQVRDDFEEELREKFQTSQLATNLRIQALRLEDQFSSGLSSSAYTTEDDDQGEEGGKDGHLGEFVAPDDELAQRILKQVESLFSDSFVYRDAFMLKHIKRGAGGFVSLRLITSLRKVKSLTPDYRVVAHALRKSKELEVNGDGTKVRRIKPLPENFDISLAQVILLSGMPRDSTIHERTSEVVRLITGLLKKKDRNDNNDESESSLSSAPSVRIIKEATHIPSAYKSNYEHLFSFDSHNCVLLDFFGMEKLDPDAVCEALKPSVTEEEDWKKSIMVHELPGVKADPTRKKTRKSRDSLSQSVESNKTPEEGSSGSTVYSDHHTRRNFTSPQQHGGRGHSNFLTPSRSTNLDSSANSGGSNSKLNLSSPWSTPGSSPRVSPHARRRSKPGPSPLAADGAVAVNSSGGESPQCSPWLARRMRAKTGSSPYTDRRSLNLDGEGKIVRQVVVLRQPKGAEEEKGFKLARTLV